MTQAPADAQQADPNRWRALAVVLCASFMILLDISIVNVAIPTIQPGIKASYTEIEFILVGYQMAYALMLITGGRLGDIFGRKRLFMIGVLGFTLASAACGFSASGTQLVISRIVQGLFAACMYPQVLSVIQVTFPPKERAAAFGIFGGIVGVATISGPLLGGFLIKLGWFDGWRPIFLVNLPIGLGAFFAAFKFLHESRAPKAQKIDFPGTLLVTVALFLLVYPLVEGRDADWAPWTFISMAVSVPVFVLFAFYTRNRSRTTGSPLVEPALFGDRAFVVGMFLIAVFFAGIPAFFLCFSIWIQVGHPPNLIPGYGFDAFSAGLTTLPFSIGSAFASGMSIRIAPKIGTRILQVGALFLVAGMTWMYFIVDSNGGTGFHGYNFIGAMALGGIGLGCIAAPLINMILASIHHGNAGSASGVLTTVQQVGGALGVAVLGVIFFGAISSHAPSVSASHNPAFERALVATGGVPEQGATSAATFYTQCFNARSAEKDTSKIPPICQTVQNTAASYEAKMTPQQASAVRAAFNTETTERLADNFSYAFKLGLIAEIVIFSLVFLVAFFLPQPRSLMGGGGAGGH